MVVSSKMFVLRFEVYFYYLKLNINEQAFITPVLKMYLLYVLYFY